MCYSDYFDGLAPFLRFHINNAGDPFISGNLAIHSRKFEVEVLDWFAILWEIDDDYWGYVTNDGTEGNFHGLLLGLVHDHMFQLYFTMKLKLIKCIHMQEREISKWDSLYIYRIALFHL